MADVNEGSAGVPNLQGPEFWEMRAQVKENTRRLNTINGQIDKIERSQELVRSDVRSLGEKLDSLVGVIGSTDKEGSLIARVAGIEKGQAATLANVSSVDWKTIGTIITLVVGPLVAAYFGSGGA